MSHITLFTIGFTKTNAESFFTKLKHAGVTKLIDIRLNNVSQLSGFAKKDDLRYFLKQLCNSKYLHKPEFAPTKEILDAYKKKQINWLDYEILFKKLMKERAIEIKMSIDELNNACLLCSEPTPEKCHRRLVAEHFKKHFPELAILHL